jgi:putative addiction module component (TIGR02574 family)
MTNASEIIANQALQLSSLERAEVVEILLVSLDQPDSAIDKLWANEADARVEAYENGDLEAVSAKEVFKKYNK